MENKKKWMTACLLGFYVLFQLSGVELNEIDGSGALLQSVIESIASKHVPHVTEGIYTMNGELIQNIGLDRMSELSNSTFH